MDAVEIPGYRLIEMVGRGAMGTVWRAFQLSMQREVAIKILSPELVADEVFTNRFLNEAKAMGKLRHAHIVSALDAGRANGVYYFVMDYVDGRTLDVVLRSEGKMPATKAMRIGAQIAHALDYAHSKGLVHRDVKPGNIIVDDSGVAKLCDLGLARPRGAAGPGGRAEGTPFYISPEQARGDAKIDHRTDIYSLGASLYHMVTGEPPFRGEDIHQTMRLHIKGVLTPVRERNPEVEEGFAAVIEKMLEKDPEKRYQTAAEAAADLEAVKVGQKPRLGRKPFLAELMAHKFFLPGAIASVGVILFLILVLALSGPTTGDGKKPGDSEKGGHEFATSRRNEKRPPPEEKPPVEAPPERPGPDLEAQRLLEESRRKVADLLRELAGPENLEALVLKLEGLLAEYDGTAAQSLLERELAKYKARLAAKRKVDEAKKALEEIETLIAAGDFAGASEKASALSVPRQLRKRLSELRASILPANQKALDDLEKKAADLAERGEFQTARDEVASLRLRSLSRLSGRFDRILAQLQRAEATHEERQALAEFNKRFDGLMKAKNYEAALDLISETLHSVTDRKAVAALEARHFYVKCVVETIKDIRADLMQIRGKEVAYRKYDGTKISGKVLAVSADSVIFETHEGNLTKRIEVKLDELDVSDLLWLRCGIDGAVFHRYGIYLAEIGHPELALKFLRQARTMGRKVDRGLMKKVIEGEKAYWETKAAEMCRRMEKLLASGKEREASKEFNACRENKRIAATATWRAEAPALRTRIRDALVAATLKDGLGAFVSGKVKKLKNGRCEIEYRFTRKEEEEDWTPRGKSRFERRGSGVIAKGILIFKVPFSGAVEMEIRAQPLSLRPANLGVVIKANQHGAYIVAIGARIGGRQNMRVHRRHPGGLRVVSLPASLVIRTNKGFGEPSCLFGSYSPRKLTNTSYRLRVWHTGEKIGFSVSGSRIGEFYDEVDRDETGCLGLWAEGSGYRVFSVKMEGKPDEKWLYSQAVQWVEQNHPHLKERGGGKGRQKPGAADDQKKEEERVIKKEVKKEGEPLPERLRRLRDRWKRNR